MEPVSFLTPEAPSAARLERGRSQIPPGVPREIVLPTRSALERVTLVPAARAATVLLVRARACQPPPGSIGAARPTSPAQPEPSARTEQRAWPDVELVMEPVSFLTLEAPSAALLEQGRSQIPTGVPRRTVLPTRSALERVTLVPAARAATALLVRARACQPPPGSIGAARPTSPAQPEPSARAVRRAWTAAPPVTAPASSLPLVPPTAALQEPDKSPRVNEQTPSPARKTIFPPVRSIPARPAQTATPQSVPLPASPPP